MSDHSPEFDRLVEHLQQALSLAADLKLNTLSFLIDRAIDEARTEGVGFFRPDRLQ